LWRKQGENTAIENNAVPEPPEPPTYWNAPTPLYYFDRWPLDTLSVASRANIRASLQEIQANFLEDHQEHFPEFNCWQNAYNVFATELERAGLLSQELIRKTIPAIVADASASARWPYGRRSSVRPSDRYTDRLGEEYYHPDYIRLFFRHSQGRIEHWLGRLELQLPSGVLQLPPVPKRKGHGGRKPVRRNAWYERIDQALSEIAAAHPKNHEEVFRFLDSRRCAIPNRKPFKGAGGWLKGFQQNRQTASVWLSQTWTRLNLPAFARGPKK
jgi:hypothetical protein